MNQKQHINAVAIMILFVLIGITPVLGQKHFGITFHQSSATKVGVFYDISDLLILETRVLDFSLIEDTSVEFLGLFKILRHSEYESYIGIGYGMSTFTNLTGVIGTIGTNVYPFENNNFGFHVELNLLFPDEPDINIGITRVSWGLRYKFGKKK